MNKLFNYALSLFVFIGLTACSDDKIKPDLGPTGPKNIDYLESDAIIFNPERGFYDFAEFRSDSNNALSLSFINNMVESGTSLIYNTYTMIDYRETIIPDAYLERIRNNMEILREGGAKTVLRFRYTNSESQKPWDPTEELVLEHIAQITPILKEYSDVIYVLEAGFIGVWGEWYYTDNFIYRPDEDEYGPRKRVLDALLEALPKNRMVAVRYPAAKIFSFGIDASKNVTRETAYNESDLSRVAFHNDCFLADQDDRGTFGGRRSHRTFLANETKYLAMGGETCQLSSFSECSNALVDLAKYHWSFMNSAYDREVIRDWEVNNCLNEIKKRLGYRFVLKNGEYTDNGHAGGPFEMKLSLENVGFAAPFNPRSVEVVFKSKSSLQEYKLKLNDDPRYWFAEEAVEINTTFGLPVDMPIGEYDVFLHLPDPEPTLYGRKNFSIQFANEDDWDNDKGYNKLATVSVKAPSADSQFSGSFLEKTN
ncbi:MAG: DUF4832 domain-containing protein [Gelidibacter sp.]